MANTSILTAFERMWQHVVAVVSSKADVKDVENLQVTLDGKVPTSRTINGKILAEDITLSASDVGASESGHNHDDRYYTETEVDEALAQKSQVQIITWEEND